jgi:Family of unknown function (DUF6011)
MIKCGHCNDRHETVADVRACAGHHEYAAKTARTAVTTNGGWVRPTLAEALTAGGHPAAVDQLVRAHATNPRMAKRADCGHVTPDGEPCAPCIDALNPRYPEGTPEYADYATDLRTELDKFAKGEPPYDPFAELAPASTPATELEDGIYFVPGDPGTVYKVVHAANGSGRPYAKRLDVIEPQADYAAPLASWSYAPGAIKQLRPEHKMTLDQARMYGKLYGVCCRCGATLTDETSIAAGIGPVCANRF